MPHDSKTRKIDQPMRVILLLAIVVLSTVGFAQTQDPAATINQTPAGKSETSSQINPLKKYNRPIEGPELRGPIIGPGSPQQTDVAVSVSTRPIDLAYGAFQRGYYLTALKLALPRAESGDPSAQTLIAELYRNGFGVAKDLKKANEWYKFAAESGNREAQFHLANSLLQGEVSKTDKKQGEIYMRKAATAGHSRAQFNVAQIITSRRPTWAGFKQALPFYKSAAEAGLADAQYALSTIYAEANGVLYNDEKTARKWLQRSAEGGFDTAQIELGIWLANGRGGKKNLARARYWFIRAAAQGNIIAQNRLARIYAYGVGVPKDAIKAGAWHILSRRAGFSDTQLDRMFQDLSEIDQKRAIEAANQLSRRTPT